MLDNLRLETPVEIDRTAGAFSGLLQVAQLAVAAGNREPVASMPAKGFGTGLKKEPLWQDQRVFFYVILC